MAWLAKVQLQRITHVCQDGIKGMILELRTEDFLPEDGKATLANVWQGVKAAPAHIYARAAVLSKEWVELLQKSTGIAKQKLEEIYAAVTLFTQETHTRDSDKRECRQKHGRHSSFRSGEGNGANEPVARVRRQRS